METKVKEFDIREFQSKLDDIIEQLTDKDCQKVEFLRGKLSAYKDIIEAGDINFFITKDYSADLARNDNADKIMESIDRLRNPVKQMSPENQAKTMKYIQNLCLLSNLYAQ